MAGFGLGGLDELGEFMERLLDHLGLLQHQVFLVLALSGQVVVLKGLVDRLREQLDVLVYPVLYLA